MRCIVFLSHFHACPIVVGDLIDVGTFEQAQASVRVAAIYRPFATYRRGQCEAFLYNSCHFPLAMDAVRLPDLPGPPSVNAGSPLAAQMVARHTLYSCNKQHVAFHVLRSLGWFDAALVFNNRNIAKLKTHCLVGTEPPARGEQNRVVKLFRFATKTEMLRIMYLRGELTRAADAVRRSQPGGSGCIASAGSTGCIRRRPPQRPECDPRPTSSCAAWPACPISAEAPAGAFHARDAASDTPPACQRYSEHISRDRA